MKKPEKKKIMRVWSLKAGKTRFQGENGQKVLSATE